MRNAYLIGLAPRAGDAGPDRLEESIRRVPPLVHVAVLVGAAVVLLYPVYTSVEWGVSARDAWAAIPLAGLVAGGYAWGRWRALTWLGVIPWLLLGLLFDAAWYAGICDRSDEYEPLPVTPFMVIFGVPAFIALVAIGVAVRKLVDRSRRP